MGRKFLKIKMSCGQWKFSFSEMPNQLGFRVEARIPISRKSCYTNKMKKILHKNAQNLHKSTQNLHKIYTKAGKSTSIHNNAQTYTNLHENTVQKSRRKPNALLSSHVTSRRKMINEHNKGRYFWRDTCTTCHMKLQMTATNREIRTFLMVRDVRGDG